MAATIRIEFARGDSYVKGFHMEQGETTVTEPFEEIYFTVKNSYEDRNYIFQKRLSTGGITSDGDGHYTLYIEPEDTNSMKFGDYDCDFEFLRNEGTYKRTFMVRMKLTKEVTYASNE